MKNPAFGVKFGDPGDPDPNPDSPAHPRLPPGPRPGRHLTREFMLRPLRHETLDGSGELGWGAALVLFALSSYVFVLWPESSFSRSAIGWTLLAGAAVAPMLFRAVIKRYLTWPRTGYVALPRSRRAFWIAILVGGLVAAVLAIVASLPWANNVVHTLPPPRGDAASALTPPPSNVGLRLLWTTLFALPNVILYRMITLGTTDKFPWKWAVLVLIALVPFAIGLRTDGGLVAISRPVMLAMGLLWLLSGCLTLLAYLRHNPPLPREAA